MNNACIALTRLFTTGRRRNEFLMSGVSGSSKCVAEWFLTEVRDCVLLVVNTSCR